MAKSLNTQEARMAYLNHCNQKGFPRPNRVRQASAVVKSSFLNYWMEDVRDRGAYLVVDVVFNALETQIDAPAQ